MSALLSFEDCSSPSLVVVFTNKELCDQLFLAALEWGIARDRRTHYVRRGRFDMIPTVPTEYFSDPARMKTITFHYMLDSPLEKAAELSADFSTRDMESLIIVETDEGSYLGEHAVANTLALLSSFSCYERRSIICFPYDENLIMVASLFTKHIYVHNDDDTLTSLSDFAVQTH
ncbi:hypothetical protein Aduo_009131 [Ancylostoma duodenale]